MSDFDEVMVLRRIGELVVQGELPPMAHGLLRLLGIAIEQEAALQQAQAEAVCLRRALDQAQAERDHLRPEAAKPSTPDFAAMSEQERKAWLDERGRRELWEWFHGKWYARLWERHAMNQLIIKVVAESEPAAILALCEAVAAKERGEDV
jgi:hypothetical protein